MISYSLSKKDVEILSRFYPRKRHDIKVNFKYLCCVIFDYNVEILTNLYGTNKEVCFVPIVSNKYNYKIFKMINDHDIITLDEIVQYMETHIVLNMNKFNVIKKSQSNKHIVHSKYFECYNVFKKSILILNKATLMPKINHNIMILNADSFFNKNSVEINEFITVNIKCIQYNINKMYKMDSCKKAIYNDKHISLSKMQKILSQDKLHCKNNMLNYVFLYGTEEDYYNELQKTGIVF